MEKKNELLRTLPKVDEAIASLQAKMPDRVPPLLVKNVVRRTIDERRRAILEDPDHVQSMDEVQWQELLLREVDKKIRHNLRRLINGTGVVIHTNLGRSLLSEKSAHALVQSARAYTNLEFDLDSGKRGSRYDLVEEIICELTGAEAALVVNNNAAAVLLGIETLAKGREAVVSRGELVEIGGSFRIPDVMAKSGARLVEVGATNRTHLYDYEKGLSEETALLLKVHTSNFRMLGFVKEVSTEELVSLAKRYGLLVMEDLGSGCLLDLSRFGLPQERTVQEVVAAGVDVVTFSGDKLLGGPQAGIIVGKAAVIKRIKKNPLNRALRIDKFTLASLESVLRCYYDIDEALATIPTLRMLTEGNGVIKKRAQRLLRKLKQLELHGCAFSLESTVSQTGGGAIPEYGLASWAISLRPETVSVNTFESHMRRGDIPLIGRIENDRFLIDLRTVQDRDIDDIAHILLSYFSS